MQAGKYRLAAVLVLRKKQSVTLSERKPFPPEYPVEGWKVPRHEWAVSSTSAGYGLGTMGRCSLPILDYNDAFSPQWARARLETSIDGRIKLYYELNLTQLPSFVGYFILRVALRKKNINTIQIGQMPLPQGTIACNLQLRRNSLFRSSFKSPTQCYGLISSSDTYFRNTRYDNCLLRRSSCAVIE